MQESNKLYFGDIQFLTDETYDEHDVIFSINFKTFND